MLHMLVKMEKNHFIHAAELFDLLAAIGVRCDQRNLPPEHHGIRMHVKRAYRARAADLAGTLDRALHQRLMAQMHTVKITERDRTGFLIFLHRVRPLMGHGE